MQPGKHNESVTISEMGNDISDCLDLSNNQSKLLTGATEAPAGKSIPAPGSTYYNHDGAKF